ncbi:MAG: hypothetical protein GX091_02830 [Peptococcaceae bacterium]|nr:hypothetical protein [Peptococcaceae bacterium]
MNTALNFENQIKEFKRQIINHIKNIPQDLTTSKLSKSNYPINLIDPADNWKIFYYNNKLQVKALESIIEQKDTIEEIESLLDTIINKGYYQTSESNKLYFNNQIREHLKKAL